MKIDTPNREMMKVDAKIVDGKPYFGLWFGYSIIINSPPIDGESLAEDKDVQHALLLIKQKQQSTGLEIRSNCIIYRPPYAVDSFIQNRSVSCKYVLWGRAFKVMRLLRKGGRMKKNVWMNGKRVVK